MADGGTNGAAGRPVVLVTGASAGIGRAVAHRFARAGFRIVAVSRGAERLAALEAELAGTAEVRTLAADVADPAIPARAVRLAMESFGRLDCLVNNAGSGRWGSVGDTDDAMLDELVDISFKAPFRFCREAVRVMKPGSAIVIVGSTYGVVGGVGGGAYSAVKAGMIGLAQTLAADYGAAGIRTNLVAPGVIRTDMTDAYWELDFFRRTNQEMTPFDREGTVEDVANTVHFLASAEGSYINGQTIALDGGWSTTKFLCAEAMAAERMPSAQAPRAAMG